MLSTISVIAQNSDPINTYTPCITIFSYHENKVNAAKTKVEKIMRTLWNEKCFYTILTKKAPTTNPTALEKKKKEYYVSGTCLF